MLTVLINKTKALVALYLLFCIGILQTQSSLDKYIESGLQSNLVLQQKKISLEKALASLKIADRLFYPSIDLKGDYQTGEGGRSIGIPAGDLLNPVYTTLNQLTSSNSFPQINNIESNFLPKNYYDVKIRTTIPIINTDLVYNRQIQKQQIVLQEYDVEIYKRELVKNIKVAYFNYMSAIHSVAIFESALKLAQEGKRINESLVSNGKSVKAYVLRSESEIQNLEARRAESKEKADNAGLYLNFLINSDSIQMIDSTEIASIDVNLIEQYLLNDASINNRIELKSLDQSASIHESLLKMNKAFWFPKLNGFLDLGAQSSDWKLTSKSSYYFAGIQLDIPLFAAGRNTSKIKQSELDLKNQQISNSYVTKQIQLSAEMARNSLNTSYKNYKASIKTLESTTAYNRLIEKGYKEGVNSFLETIDARNQLTSASLQLIINKFQLLAALATYEREISK